MLKFSNCNIFFKETPILQAPFPPQVYHVVSERPLPVIIEVRGPTLSGRSGHDGIKSKRY